MLKNNTWRGQTQTNRLGQETLSSSLLVGEKMNSGFTLMELLVVVLIIGILAAVALPQYNKAVMKSRVAEYEVQMKALGDAAAVCKLQKGSTCTRDELDMEIPECNVIPGVVANATGCAYSVNATWISAQNGNTEIFRYYYEPAKIVTKMTYTPGEGWNLTHGTAQQGFYCGGNANNSIAGYCAKLGFSHTVASTPGFEMLFSR